MEINTDLPEWENELNDLKESNKNAVLLILENLKGLSVYEAQLVLYKTKSIIEKKTII